MGGKQSNGVNTYRISEIPGHEGYFVDTDGNVFSQWVNRGQHGVVKSAELSMLKTSIGANGYKVVHFGRKGEKVLVHRLIYEVFNGRIEEGLYICHIDGNPSNNSLINLYAGTQKDNMQDALRHGRCSLSKLTEKEVREILSLKGKMMVKDIAYLYGVGRHSITNIFQGRSWRHLTEGCSNE